MNGNGGRETRMDDIGETSSGAARIRSSSATIDLAWAGGTHPGHVRSLNEDSWCAASPVFVVCDGMGGHASGEVASSLATGVVSAMGSPSATRVHQVLDAVADANRIILQHSGGGERSMGTTLTGVAIVDQPGPAAAVVNVGDSRTYLLRSGVLEQVSTDHSQVQELIDQGLITREEAATHPERNVVTRALGIDPQVEVDIVMRDLRHGDRWLACSDGLTAELDPAALLDALGSGDGRSAVQALLRRSLAGAARDNITVVVVDVLGIDTIDDPDRTDPRRNDITEPNRRVHVDATATDVHEDPTDDAPPMVLIDSVPTSAAAPAVPDAPAPDRALIDSVPPAAWPPPDAEPGPQEDDPA